jgi:uncharacterized protein (DUF2237 family)
VKNASTPVPQYRIKNQKPSDFWYWGFAHHQEIKVSIL